MDPTIADLANKIVHFRQLVNCNVATFTVLVLDYAFTFDLEVSLIWKSNRSIMKFLFFLARYMPFMDLVLVFYILHEYALSRRTCQIIHSTITWISSSGIAVAEIILALRTWAIWERDRRLMFALPIFLAAVCTSGLVVLSLYLKTAIYEPSPIPQLFGCVVQNPNSILSGCYIILMIYDGVTLSLVAIRAVPALKQGNSHLMRVVYRDGIIYYFYLFILALINVILINKVPKDSLLLLVTMERVAHSVLACRVILHIQQQAYVSSYGGTSDIEDVNTEWLAASRTNYRTSRALDRTTFVSDVQ